MSWAIKCESLGKLYQIGKTNVTAAEIFNQKLGNMLSLGRRKASAGLAKLPGHESEARRILDDAQIADAPANHFWALKNIDLDVSQGDRVGIIGPNGCGKSTLLKILSRITPPSLGQFRFKGRLVSLLEIGTGFHGDLTGRENIYLNGSIMGMKPAEIRLRFDEMVEFSELGELIDTPVKRYSSGMYVRLAFAVAAHLESEILIVDEVLAVGDAAFQRKCSEKMLQVSGEGRTLIFVSHDMDAINRICNRAVRMEHGRIVEDSVLGCAEVNGGAAADHHSVADLTRSYIRSGVEMIRSRKWSDTEKAPVFGSLRLHGARLMDSNGTEKDRLEVKEDITIEIDYSILNTEDPVNLHLHLKDFAGHYVMVSMDNLLVDHRSPRTTGRYRSRCTISAPLLNCGDYRVDFEVWPGHQVEPRYLYPSLLTFTVFDDNSSEGVRGYWPNQWPNCLIRPATAWAMERLGAG
jgi:lipopolysaccharide transport system ATP-binding protein